MNDRLGHQKLPQELLRKYHNRLVRRGRHILRKDRLPREAGRLILPEGHRDQEVSMDGIQLMQVIGVLDPEGIIQEEAIQKIL